MTNIQTLPQPVLSATGHSQLPLLDIRNLGVSYFSKGQQVAGTSGVNVQVYPGQITALVGESGSGKSTTAHAVMGILPPNALIGAGEILFGGRLLSELSPTSWQKIRGKKIALVPQDPGNSLNPLKTIGAFLAEGFRIHHEPYTKQDLINLLERVGIDQPEKRLNQYPHELSGGMKQRVLIAAAVSLKPELIIADEPTSALDVTVQAKVLDLLDELRKETGCAMLLITHDLAVAGDRADQVVVMERGEVREQGLAANVLTDPKAPYTQTLINNAPSLTSTPLVQPASTAAPTLLEVAGLSKSFGSFQAVQDVSFQVAQGTTHALVGESGSGKTTTGRMIAGFETATAGMVKLAGQDITILDGQKRFGSRDLRRKIQMVYQNPLASLDPRWSIGKTLAEPLKNLTATPKDQIDDKIAQFLQLVALTPDFAKRHPKQLSGGQRQRVAIARTLITEPELVVLDEAVSALDVTVQAQILELLADLQEQLGVTYIFITHDLAVVKQIAHTVSVLQRGQQVEQGLVDEVYAAPQADFTKQLLAAIPGGAYKTGALNLGL